MKKYWLILTVGLFLISSVYVAIEASATGAEIKSLEEKRLLLEKANTELKEILVKGISGTEMAAKSADLGFVKPDSLIYLRGNAGQDQALINSFSR